MLNVTVFCGQETQVELWLAPVAPEYVSARQSRQEEGCGAPTVDEYLPAAQSAQELASVEPVLVRYLPAAQPVHGALPLTDLYLPATHATQGPPSAPVCPALHRQLLAMLLPVRDVELPAQSEHADEPTEALYLPATQATQVAPSGPVVPGIHRQSVMKADACEEFELLGHTWQVGLPVSDHVPALHALQVSAPVAPCAAEYRPPAHLEHS